MADVYKCTKESDIATLKTQVKELKDNQSIIYELSINITKLVEQMRETKEDVKDIKDDVRGTKQDIDELKSKPAKNYEKVMWIAIGVIVAYLTNKMLGVL